jgi:hypothetical protein
VAHFVADLSVGMLAPRKIREATARAVRQG